MGEEEIAKCLVENGIELKKRMYMFMYDENYYIDLLKDFIKENDIDKIESCISCNDYETAEYHIDNLITLTDTFGLSRANEASKELSNHLQKQSKEEISQKVNEIRTSYQRLNRILYHQHS